MTTIKPEVIAKIQESQKAKNRLAYELNKHSVTIDRYLENNDEMLTTKTALLAISEELGISESEIISA
jgi:hypothetical protein